MILIVGGTGRLGSAVARQLLADGKPVRVLTRDPAKAQALKELGAEVVQGDLRDAASLGPACRSVERVLAAATAFDGRGTNTPQTVDDAGNRHLVDAARQAGVKHFVLTSMLGARPDHPLDAFRCKSAAEAYLRSSGLSYTILRPAAFMEFWAALIGEPILRTGKTTIFGRGNNPVNFVSVRDVARFALIALEDPKARNSAIDIGGPENLSLNQVAAIFERVAGRPARKSHIPLPMMRVMSKLMRPVNPAMARQIAAGVLMDTTDQTFDMTQTLQQFPGPLVRLENLARQPHA